MDEEKKITNKQEKQKRKRKVSLITVFLWIFLIAVMSVITLSGIKKKSALEIIDNNWNIGLNFYDRTSDTPNQAITDFTWNATSSDETKQLVMQINYNCTTGKQYQPGEIVIEIPGINEDSFSEFNRNNESKYRDWLNNNITIGADEVSNKNKNYDFSYEYNYKSNVYTFTNNKKVEENENFEGTIQILYNLEPNFRNNLELQFKAKIKENIASAEEIIAMESNICNFYYTASKKSYTLENKASLASKSIYKELESVIEDYYWISCVFNVSKIDNTGALSALGENNVTVTFYSDCIRETLPEGCVVYDSKFKEVERNENNIYYVLTSESYVDESTYYIGYPKSKYNVGDEITNTAELWGRYEDEEEVQKLAESGKTISLKDFNFEYNGELYSITKSRDSKYGIYESFIKSTDGCKTRWNMKVKAFYTGSLMDVEICDDLLYITRENGSITRLTENEYNFTEIEIPIFYTYDKYTDRAGDMITGYPYEVQVRYRGSNEYVKYSDGIIKSRSQTVGMARDDVVGVKLIIKNLNTTIYPESSSNYRDTINIGVNVHTNNCKKGYVYNLSYIQVYNKDDSGNRVIANNVTANSYDRFLKLIDSEIATYDISKYGRYMQRGYAENNITSGSFEISVSKYNKDLKNNVRKEKYEMKYALYNSLDIDNFSTNNDCIIKKYDILPEGVNLVSTKEEIIEAIYTSEGTPLQLQYSKLKLKDGTRFKTLEELMNYIKNNTIVEIDYNYKNSGRTKVSIMYNLSEIDWSYYSNNKTQFPMYLGTVLNVEIPYDSILEYGTTYKNYVYSMWEEQGYSYDWESISDNGEYDILASDIDEDEDTTENLVYADNILNISHAISSQQAVIKQVRTDLTKGKFISKTADVSAGSEYTYKLKVTTGANSLKDLIIYDTLETIYDEKGKEIKEGWKGEFLGVDTSYAVSKGYAPKVYYSVEKNPGKLTEVPDKWKELTDEIDKSTVKSICVDLRYKTDGSEMELSSNNVVFVLVNMRAPEDESIISSSSNMFSTNWRAKDTNGTVIDNIEGIYSNKINVNIYKIENEKKDIEGKKTWEYNRYEEEYRPESITVKLMQDGVEYLRKEVSEETNWEYVFEDVPVYKNEELEEYEYSVEEVEVPMYEAIYDGYNITNKLKTTDIEIEKIWDDNDNEKGLRPIHFIIRIYDGEKLVYDGWLDGCYEWFGLKKTISLPMYRPDGSEIEYRIDEEVPKNLDFYVSGEYITDPNFNTEDGLEQYNKHYVKKIDGYTVTNKYIDKEEKIKITGKKVWEDDENKALKRPDSVILQIKAGEEVVSEAVVSESTNWSCEFEVLKYDEVGNEINYYIDERTTPKFYEKELTNETTVTNKFVVSDEKVKIEVIKIWEDLENKYKKRPKNITLQVLNGENVVEEKKVNEKDNWKVEFELLKYDELGNEIEYTVNEKEEVKHYEKRISGYTVINKCIYEPGEKPSLPSTSDINIFIYVAISFVAIVGTIALILVLKKNKK